MHNVYLSMFITTYAGAMNQNDEYRNWEVGTNEDIAPNKAMALRLYTDRALFFALRDGQKKLIPDNAYASPSIQEQIQRHNNNLIQEANQAIRLALRHPEQIIPTEICTNASPEFQDAALKHNAETQQRLNTTQVNLLRSQYKQPNNNNNNQTNYLSHWPTPAPNMYSINQQTATSFHASTYSNASTQFPIPNQSYQGNMQSSYQAETLGYSNGSPYPLNTYTTTPGIYQNTSTEQLSIPNQSSHQTETLGYGNKFPSLLNTHIAIHNINPNASTQFPIHNQSHQGNTYPSDYGTEFQTYNESNLYEFTKQ